MGALNLSLGRDGSRLRADRLESPCVIILYLLPSLAHMGDDVE